MERKFIESARVAFSVIMCSLLVPTIFFLFLFQGMFAVLFLLFAIVGCTPIYFVYAFLSHIIQLNIREVPLKWIAFVLATLLSANATLYVAFYFLDDDFFNRLCQFDFTDLNALVSLFAIGGLLFNIRNIHRTFFKLEPPEDEI